MNNHLPPKFVITAIAISSVLCFAGLIFAQDAKTASSVEDISDVKKVQARKYRELGVEFQRMGNLTEALSFYQKALALDSSYAVVYNDLGVIYEAMGFPERAKESYFKSIKIDPAYLSAYTNIALFYEEQRDLERAAFYWAKRAELGSPDDPWAQKAASRFKDIRAVLSNKPIADAQEEDVLGLIKDISIYKSVFDKDDRAQAQNHLSKAKQYYKNNKLTAAIKEALEALDLDQSNPEIKELIEKIDSDPVSAAVAYKDLGVVYEAAGLPERAEESYLKSLEFDPTLLSAYVNIALFYEKQRDLEKAKFYWAKRAELGSSEDPWTKKSANRVKDIRTVLSSRPFADAREEDVLDLMKDVSRNKTELNQDSGKLAQAHFEEAKLSFNKGDMATAIKEALDAQCLDENNPEIEAFIDKAELRALTR